MQSPNYTSGIRKDGAAVIYGTCANGDPMIIKIETRLNIKELRSHLKWIDDMFKCGAVDEFTGATCVNYDWAEK